MSYIANLFPGSNGTSRATRNAKAWNAEAALKRAAYSTEVPSQRTLLDQEQQEAADTRAAQALATQQVQEAENARIDREVLRKTILTLPDSERVLGDAPMSMSKDDAEAYNMASWNAFSAKHPEWHGTAENVAALKNYFAVNHIQIISEAAFEHAVKRLTESGHISVLRATVEAPAPVAARAKVTVPQVFDVNAYDFYSRNSKRSDLISGWSLDGSNTRVTMSARKVDQLTSDQYKIFAHIGR